MSLYCRYNKERISTVLECGTEASCDCHMVDYSPVAPIDEKIKRALRAADWPYCEPYVTKMRRAIVELDL